MDRRLLRAPDLEVRLLGEAPRVGQRLEFDDVRVATMFVARLMADPRDAEVLRRLAGELAHVAGDERDVVAGLAGALVASRLVLTRPGVRRDAIVLPPDEEHEAKPGEESFAAMQSGPPTHWVEVQLLGEDGEGIPGQPYRIISPDEVEWRGFTDSLGIARVSRIPAGMCQVFFPELDAEAWEPEAQAAARKAAGQDAAARGTDVAATPTKVATTSRAEETTSPVDSGEPRHWVEIQLFGEDGEPIASEPYLIVAADGVEWRGRTNADGMARLSPIPAGTCRVSFPELDAEAWDPA